MKEEYTTKEILLGLRDECLRIQAKLNKIDSFLDYDRDKYKIESYLLGDNIESYLLKLCPKNNTIFNRLKKTINYQPMRLSRVSKQINGLYGLVDFEDRKVTINLSKRYDFDYLIKEIANYNFSILNNKAVTNLKIMPTLLEMNIKNNLFLRYWSIDDTIEFIDCNNNLTSNQINKMLNYTYENTVLSDRLKEIINNNKNSSKQIVLKDGKFKHDESFYLIERPKTFVLRKERKTIF